MDFEGSASATPTVKSMVKSFLVFTMKSALDDHF